MNEPVNLSLEKIRKAAESLKQIRPLYGNAIEYYEQILIAQEMVKEDLQLNPIKIPRCHFKLKVKKNMPLVKQSVFKFDERATKILLEKICDLIETTGSNSPAMTQKFKAIINDDGFELKSFLSNFLNRDENEMNRLASLSGLDRGFLFHVTYQSLKPSIQSFAKCVSSYFPSNFYWNKGVCPICGGTPTISTLDDNGKRFLYCSFCWHKWRVNRGFCPFCGNNNPEALQYFCSEEEVEYRVELCEKCKTYIKCVDARNTNRFIYPPIEQVATIHLDMAAQEDGYIPSAGFFT